MEQMSVKTSCLSISRPNSCSPLFRPCPGAPDRLDNGGGVEFDGRVDAASRFLGRGFVVHGSRQPLDGGREHADRTSSEPLDTFRHGSRFSADNDYH